jgi:hypothetical protein
MQKCASWYLLPSRPYNARAVFTAIGSGEHDGDTGRCGIAEAMVRSLEWEGAANVDFGVGTRERRTIPTEEEWDELFRGCISS